jgi:aminoglycoside 6'-N-acetyltransferase
MTAYSFRPATHADLPMLRRWLETPEVARWWRGPDAQEALLREDLDNDLMAMLIVSADDRPFAYAQHYDVHSWPQPHFDGFPPATRAIDIFLGEPNMLGQGHGSAFLRILAAQLLQAGAPAIAIDPDLSNERARRAYAAAGFVERGAVETDEGPAMLMVFIG